MAPAEPALLLLRHGQSEWNAVRRWQGLADPPLTDLGRQQAGRTAAALARLPGRIGSVWSSDLRRASETAEIIDAELDTGGIRLDPRLREADAGPWEGFTPEEIERRWPGWLGAHRRPDGFEPADSVVERATAACVDLVRSAGEHPVMAVTHSGVIRVMRRHLGLDDHRIANLDGAWFGLDASGRLQFLQPFEAAPASRPT